MKPGNRSARCRYGAKSCRMVILGDERELSKTLPEWGVFCLFRKVNDLLKKLDKNQLPGSEAEVFHLLGMTDRDPVSERIRKMARREIQVARDLIEPRGLWEIGPLYTCGDGSICLDGLALKSQDLQRHLTGYENGVLLAVTIGDSLEAEVEALFSAREYTRATMLDAAGSQFTEEAANQITELFRQTHGLGESGLSRRFSPGYGDWDIQIQPEILKRIQAYQIGLACNEACILVPRKSITAIAGYTQAKAKM